MKPLAQVPQAMRRSGIREIMDLARRKPDVIHLEVGQPDFDTPKHIVQAACQAAQEGHTRYTANAGMLSLREVIARKVRRFNAFEVAPDQITVTPGAVCAMATGLMALVDPGDEVLIPDPGWPNYRMALLCIGGVPIPYPLDKDKAFQLDLRAVEDRITDRTKVIIINSPSNPTGAVFPGETIEQLVRLAADHDVYVMSDEVYEEIVFEGQHTSAARFDDDGRVLTVCGLSKSYAMTGWRVGYVIASKALSSVITKLQEPFVSCASSVSQRAAEAALNGPQDSVRAMVHAYHQRRDMAVKLIKQHGLYRYSPQGAFYMLIDIGGCGVDSYTFCKDLLEHRGVAAAPGATFGSVSEAFIRVSLATAEEDVMEGVSRICRYILKLREKA